MQFFLTATDTEVGKTHVAAGLVRAWRAAGQDALALKPFSAGSREDAERLSEAMGSDHPEDINPVHVATPAAPLMATEIEGLPPVDVATATACVQRHQQVHTHLIVEGIGGWLVPLAPEVTVREWAVELGLPVVVVARGALGTLNHTLLTVESIRASGLEVLGIFLNHGAPEPGEPDDNRTSAEVRKRNAPLLRRLTGLPVTELLRQEEPFVEIPLWLAGKEG